MGSAADGHAGFEGEMAVWSNGEVDMPVQTGPHAVAHLVEAAVLQEEFARQRWALEWGELVFAELVRIWNHLESHESLAYEDKVTAQIRVLDEATSTLWRLHKPLAQTRRRLRRHRQDLRHLTARTDL